MVNVACTCIGSPDGEGMTHFPDCPIAIIDARMSLASLLRRLPYGDSLDVPPPDGALAHDATETQYLYEIACWISLLSERLAQVKSVNTEMARELTELREQRRQVRLFLGIA